MSRDRKFAFTRASAASTDEQQLSGDTPCSSLCVARRASYSNVDSGVVAPFRQWDEMVEVNFVSSAPLPTDVATGTVPFNNSLAINAFDYRRSPSPRSVTSFLFVLLPRVGGVPALLRLLVKLPPTFVSLPPLSVSTPSTRVALFS